MNEDEDIGIARGDTLSGIISVLALVMFVIVVMIVEQFKEEETATPVGNIVVSTQWPSGDFDIDTWVFGPGEARPVGYSNRNGKVFSLIKDDLGFPDTDLNYESVISRGIPAGRYWVNLHAYRGGQYPLTVKVSVEVFTGAENKDMGKVVSTEVVLTRLGDERTAFSFELTGEGKLVPGTTNSVFRPLRAASAGTL